MIPKNRYGFTRGLVSPTPVLTQNDVTWAANLGLSRCRLQQKASNIWINQGDPWQNWSWASYDAAIALLTQFGFWIEVTCDGLPTWGLANPIMQATTEPFFMDDPATCLTYCQGVLSRYNGIFNIPGYGPMKVHRLTVANEQQNVHHTTVGAANGIRFSPFAEYNSPGVPVGSQIEPARDGWFHYWKLLNIITTLRNQFPGIQIGMGALWWWYDLNFADHITGLGQALGLIDFMNGHIYTNTNEPLNANGHIPSISVACSNMRSSANALGFSHTPISITEFGWQVPTDCTEQQQAQRYQQCLDYFRQRGDIESIYLFTITDNQAANSVVQSSVVQWNFTGNNQYHFMQSYNQIGNYIAQFPDWQLSAGMAA